MYGKLSFRIMVRAGRVALEAQFTVCDLIDHGTYSAPLADLCVGLGGTSRCRGITAYIVGPCSRVEEELLSLNSRWYSSFLDNHKIMVAAAKEISEYMYSQVHVWRARS